MKRITFISIALACCASLAAQNINQSVQVTNDYVSRFTDINKNGVALAVPDSLYRFDYDFDYSVFETPYKGSYEFSPYMIQVTPESSAYDGSKLYVRAGAGFRDHPHLDVVYNPLVKENLALSVYNHGSGYHGKYYNGVTAGSSAQQRYNGYDLSDRLGVEGRYLFKGNTLRFDAGYDGIYAAKYERISSALDAYNGSSMHAARLHADIASDPSSATYFFYKLALNYRYSGDRKTLDKSFLGEHAFDVSGSVGPVLKQKFSMLIDFSYAYDTQKIAYVSTQSMLVDVKPHFVFTLGPVNIDAGAKIDYSSSSTSSKFSVVPSARAKLSLFKGRLDVFAGVDGGQKMYGFADAKNINHFVDHDGFSAVYSREKLNVYAGFNGSVSSQLQYNFKGGYSSVANNPLLALGGVALVDTRQAYADLALAWVSERVTVDGNLRFRYDINHGLSERAFLPAMLSGDIRGVYNWNKRIYAGLWVDASMKRTFLGNPGSACSGNIPGYVNLGLDLEYKLSRRLGLWLQGGNLMGMAIEKVPGVVEKSPYFTAGITFKI